MFPNDNWQLGGSDVIGLTRGLISCYQSFAPMADIAVVLPVFTYGQIDVITSKYVIINRWIHALFHIKTVIILRHRYRPKGFSTRVDIGRGMITILIWEKACINLFITYFNIELKTTKLTSHTDTNLTDMSDRYRLRVLLPKRQQNFPR